MIKLINNDNNNNFDFLIFMLCFYQFSKVFHFICHKMAVISHFPQRSRERDASNFFFQFAPAHHLRHILFSPSGFVFGVLFQALLVLWVLSQLLLNVNYRWHVYTS